jgi:aldose 1-epimerase
MTTDTTRKLKMNALLKLETDDFSVTLNRHGALVVSALWRGQPILRSQSPVKRQAGPMESSCFPLVPFGNRVAENSFKFRDKRYELTANTAWDRHYLHGDGWISDWNILQHGTNAVELELVHVGDIYNYTARQCVTVDENTLTISLSVRNDGYETMPFGLGFHPYFPLSKQTKLMAPATRYWTEKGDFLPGNQEAIPKDLDFNSPNSLPRRWINNGFEGWNGLAEIFWPERNLSLGIKSSENMSRYFLFHSSPEFEPDFAGDYFCFEPVTHSANAHNLPTPAGLVPLDPNCEMRSRICMEPRVSR